MAVRVHAARSEQDRRLQRHVAEAVRALRRAQDACPVVPRHRRRRVAIGPQIEELARALRVLDGIGHLTPSVDYTDPDMMPEDQKHLLAGVFHLEAVEEHLGKVLEGVKEALASFHRADEIRPLEGEALVEARRARHIARALGEAERLVGGVRTAAVEELEDPDLVRRAKPRPKPRRDEDS